MIKAFVFFSQLEEYIVRTVKLRGSCSQLLLCHVKPNAPTYGRLWSPTRKAQTTLLKAEYYFRNTCKPGQCQWSITIHDAIEKSHKDPDVVSSFNAIVSEASLKIENPFSRDSYVT